MSQRVVFPRSPPSCDVCGIAWLSVVAPAATAFRYALLVLHRDRPAPYFEPTHTRSVFPPRAIQKARPPTRAFFAFGLHCGLVNAKMCWRTAPRALSKDCACRLKGNLRRYRIPTRAACAPLLLLARPKLEERDANGWKTNTNKSCPRQTHQHPSVNDQRQGAGAQVGGNRATQCTKKQGRGRCELYRHAYERQGRSC
jgi:hypothetical protein